MSVRDMSISTALGTPSKDGVPLEPTPIAHPVVPLTSSHLPKLVPHVAQSTSSSPSKSPKKTPKRLPLFINRSTNDTIAWDTDQRLEEVEHMQRILKEEIKGATAESNGLKEMTAVYKTRSMSIDRS